MLRQKQDYLSAEWIDGFMLTSYQMEERSMHLQPESGVMKERFDVMAEETEEPETEDAPLEDAARGERDYVRQRLREELKREPTEAELDEWLRQHTEGY
jgi:hypothetical protein